MNKYQRYNVLDATTRQVLATVSTSSPEQAIKVYLCMIGYRANLTAELAEKQWS